MIKLALFTLLVAAALTSSASAININTFGAASTESFDSLASTGTSSTLPADWSFFESGSSANTAFTAGTGSSTTGDTYSFGAANSAERALGTLRSGSVVSTIGVSFTNSVAGGTITSLAIGYTGEQWRLGTAGRTDRLDFQYSLNATSLSTGLWVDVNALDFTTPNTATSGATDGNLAVNRSLLSSTISGLGIASGATFWLRWTDLDVTGADDGLAVDDFSLTAYGTTLPQTGVPDTGTNILLLALGLAGLAAFRKSVERSTLHCRPT